MKRYSLLLLLVFSSFYAFAISYSDLMYQAEKLTEQRYEKDSRAYKIRARELDAIMESKDSIQTKISLLKRLIAELQEIPPLKTPPVKSAPEKKVAPVKKTAVLPPAPKPRKPTREEILRNLHKKADHGDVKAQFTLAKHYEQQFQDRERLKYLRKAASNGHAEANFILGRLYMDGDGSAVRSNDQAFRHFLRAKELGVKKALPHLAWCYLKGKGTIPDLKKAFELYETIYKSGDLRSGAALGNFYYEGSFPKKDHAKALRYFESALKTGELGRFPGEFRIYAPMGKIYYYGEYGAKKDRSRACQLLKEASFERDAESFLLLGRMHLDGEGSAVPRDPEKALQYFLQADMLGCIQARGILGRMYHNGIGTEKDLVTASRFLTTAAEHGDLEAGRLLGEMLYAKKGSFEDDKKAFHYFLALTRKEDAEALCRCGAMAQEGRGTEKDLKRAAAFFKRAAAKGHPDGLYFCGMEAWKKGDKKDAFNYLRTAADHGHKEAVHFVVSLLLDGKQDVKQDIPAGMNYLRKLADTGDRKAQERFAKLCQDPVSGQIKKDLDLAVRYYRLAAAQKSIMANRQLAKIAFDKGDYKQAFIYAEKALSLGKDPESSAVIGSMYYDGKGCKKDPEKALKYLLEPANLGDMDAIDKVGRLYYASGRMSEAEKYLLKSSNADNAEILFMRGRIHYLGIRSSGPDYPRALKLLLSGAEKGNVDCMLLIGRMYHRGEGMHQDFAQARRFFRQAADQGSAEGMYLVGSMYYNGEGVSPDYLEAMNWFKKAAQKDHIVAMQYISIMYKEGIGVARNNREAIHWRNRIRNLKK